MTKEKNKLNNFWWGYFLIFPCWWFFRWRNIGFGKVFLKIISTPLVLLDILFLCFVFIILFLLLIFLAPRKFIHSLKFLWDKKIPEEKLAVWWLTFFDIRFPWVKKRKKKIFCIGLPKTGTTSVHHALHQAK